jgi:hypothetical protein
MWANIDGCGSHVPIMGVALLMDTSLIINAAGAEGVCQQPASGLFQHPASLHPDRFDHLHIVVGEGKLFGLEIFFHVLRVRGAGQGEHPDLYRKSKDDLCETSP